MICRFEFESAYYDGKKHDRDRNSIFNFGNCSFGCGIRHSGESPEQYLCHKENMQEIRAALDGHIEDAKISVDEMVEETLSYSMEKAERGLERISNDKICRLFITAGTQSGIMPKSSPQASIDVESTNAGSFCIALPYQNPL